LGEVSPKLSPEECTAALLEGNAKKNRDKNIYPGIAKGYSDKKISSIALQLILKSSQSHSS
jgi:hypothetical protein